MLAVKDINTYYGKKQVLWGVSLQVHAAEIVALIGANGAGKTTLLKTISGSLRPASGTVEFKGRHIEGLKPHVIVEMGLVHIPEGRRLFPDMSIRENLEMGAYVKRVWDRKQETMDEVYKLFPVLSRRRAQLARTLSGGEQEMVAIGRGMMSRPQLCIIDEPSSGLAPIVVDEIFQIIQTMRHQGIAVLLVEQNVPQTLEIADRAYVMENGRIVLEGNSKELLEQEMIRKAYLGL
jgi:branched-chain amino acid transport system ATP-binding protein